MTWCRVSWWLGLGLVGTLSGCVDLPTVGAGDASQPDTGAAQDAGLSGDEGVPTDAGAYVEPACERPVAAALSFRSTESVVLLDEASIAPLGAQFTFEAWVRLHGGPAATALPTMILAREDEVEGGLLLHSPGAPTGALCVARGGPGGSTTLCTEHAVAPGQWTHVAMTLDGALATLFVDGQPLASGTIVAPHSAALVPTYGTTVAGSWHPSLMRYDGGGNVDVDSFALHRGVRYLAAFEPPTELVADPATVGLYACDERTGDSLADATGRSQPAHIEHGIWLDGCERRAYFGDGIDGAVVITGVVELTRDMQYESLSVLAGATLRTGGFTVRVRNLATIDGVIENNGAPGAPGTDDAGGHAGEVLLSASRLAGMGVLRARGGDGAGSGSGGSGGLVRVTTEDLTLPTGMSVDCDGGTATPPAEVGITGVEELVTVSL